MSPEPLDLVPLWIFFLLATAGSLLGVEGGYRIGSWRHAQAIDEKESSVTAMVGSILGLLAFMLAFTFGLASTRFDARRSAVLEEANAIGTTYLRARLLPEPQRSSARILLRDYTELRTRATDPATIADVLAKSEELHQQLWTQATAAAEQDPHSITTGLFLQSLNETIDLHAQRVFVGMQSRIPQSIWLALFSLTLLGMSSVGYQAGLSATRRSPEMALLALAFAIVLFLIVDLDRSHEGLLEVSQQAMIDLFKSMQKT